MSEKNQPKNTAKPGANSPAEKAGVNWEMPAPIFRVSEGITVSKKPADAPLEKGAQIVHGPLPDSPPDLTSLPGAPVQSPPDELVLEPVPEKKSANSVFGLLITAAGIVVMLLFAAALLGLIYFYFFYKAEPSSGF